MPSPVLGGSRPLTALAGFALAAAGLLAGSAAPAGAYERTTFLVSRATDGGLPNGASRNPSVSHDQRIARLLAYESDASNIVRGDTNGVSDVFVVRRRKPWGVNGTPWRTGATEIASVGLGGRPANGPSGSPALDGDSHNIPRCVAFISAASNLVRGDTNGVPDAFVRDLDSGRTIRVSVDSRGRQANGASYEVSIDGSCSRVAFTSDATNLSLRSTRRPGWRSAATRPAGAPVKQVYVHYLRPSGHDRSFRGLTFAVSASRSGREGNRDSWQPSFARGGRAVSFTSSATNFARGDRNSAPDVYLRTFTRKHKRSRGGGYQALRFDTVLVSGRNGRAGNGASQHPSVTDDGGYVAYETTASNLLSGDTNGVSDIVETRVRGGRTSHIWVSKSAATTIGNGPSNNPVISGAGEFVLFDSAATSLKESAAIRNDANGVRDVFLWNRPTGNVSLESRDSGRGYLNQPSYGPATSARGNYVLFLSRSPLADLSLSGRFAGLAPGAAPELVYMRYLGPK